MKLFPLFIVAMVMVLTGAHRDPGFDFGMKSDVQYRRNFDRHPEQWRRVKSLFGLYLKHKARVHLSKAAYRIPKKIHVVWLGSPLPDFARKMCDSWRVMHPSWVVKVWSSEDVEAFHLKNKAAYDRSRNWGEKSDIVRYEILEREGGLYVDTDFECLRPFDSIAKTADCFFGLAYSEGAPHFNNALIGCRPHHPLLKLCVDSIQAGNGDHCFQRILNTTGPHFFTTCANSCLWPDGRGTAPDLGIVAPFPVLYFYPFPDARRGEYRSIDTVKRDFVHPETYAVHYWRLSWLPPWKPLTIHDTKWIFPEFGKANRKKRSHTRREGCRTRFVSTRFDLQRPEEIEMNTSHHR